MARQSLWLLLILACATQINSALAQAKAKTSTPISRCHGRISRLDGITEGFTKRTTGELGEIRTFLEGCLQNSYDQLSKRDLSLAAIELEWVQYALDQTPEDSDADYTTTTTDPKIARSDTAVLPPDSRQQDGSVMVTVSPLELGSTFYITFAGKQHTCDVSTTARVVCKYYPGTWHYDYSTQKNEMDVGYHIFIGAVLVNNGKTYAMGCVESDHTCLRPAYGQTLAVIDGSTIRFPAWNVGWTDPDTGRKLDEQPALFTLLGALPN